MISASFGHWSDESEMPSESVSITGTSSGQPSVSSKPFTVSASVTQMSSLSGIPSESVSITGTSSGQPSVSSKPFTVSASVTQLFCLSYTAVLTVRYSI
jgi:hypothetical protein